MRPPSPTRSGQGALTTIIRRLVDRESRWWRRFDELVDGKIVVTARVSASPGDDASATNPLRELAGAGWGDAVLLAFQLCGPPWLRRLLGRLLAGAIEGAIDGAGGGKLRRAQLLLEQTISADILESSAAFAWPPAQLSGALATRRARTAKRRVASDSSTQLGA